MASEDCSILPDVELFESLFSKFNDYYFENELVKPVITISPDRHRGRILGYCTCQKVWTENKKYSQKEIENMTMEEFEAYMDEGSYEINIVAEYMNRSLEGLAETLLHEMCHLLNLQRGVRDTSRYGSYHNENFRKVADTHGLISSTVPNYGYAYTELTDETKDFLKSLGNLDFKIYRKNFNKHTKRRQSTRKYVCPICGTIIRATRSVNIGCLDCNVAML